MYKQSVQRGEKKNLPVMKDHDKGESRRYVKPGREKKIRTSDKDVCVKREIRLRYSTETPGKKRYRQ
jgi:hypothetical protein